MRHHITPGARVLSESYSEAGKEPARHDARQRHVSPVEPPRTMSCARCAAASGSSVGTTSCTSPPPSSSTNSTSGGNVNARSRFDSAELLARWLSYPTGPCVAAEVRALDALL